MNYREHFKKNFHFAYPVTLSQMGHMLVGLADSVMVGHLGKGPLAAASFANSVFAVVFTFGIGVSVGLSPLVAKTAGEGDNRQVVGLFKNSLVINSVMGLVLLLLTFGLMYTLPYMGQPQEVNDLAGSYLSILGWSVLPLMLFQTGRQLAEGLAITKQAMFITLFCNVLNVGMNYVFIYGHYGFEPMGLYGAGLATFISRIVMAVLMFWFLLRSKRMSFLSKFYGQVKIEKEKLRKLLKLGLPTGLQTLFEVSAFSFAAVMCGWLGTTALAAHQIAWNVCSITYMMATGIASAAMVRVGNRLGAKDLEGLKKAGYSNMFMVVVFMSAVALCYTLFRHIIPTFYIDDAKVILLAGELLVVAALFQLSDGLQVVANGALRGLQDVKIPSVFVLMAYWVAGLPMAYLLAFEFGLGTVGIWYGFLIGLTVTALCCVWRFRNLTRKLVGKEAGAKMILQD
ncbi:MATE family efflux transporter [Fulvitalea axinellae]